MGLGEEAGSSFDEDRFVIDLFRVGRFVDYRRSTFARQRLCACALDGGGRLAPHATLVEGVINVDNHAKSLIIRL